MVIKTNTSYLTNSTTILKLIKANIQKYKSKIPNTYKIDIIQLTVVEISVLYIEVSDGRNLIFLYPIFRLVE